jgi:hypothetical protein
MMRPSSRARELARDWFLPHRAEPEASAIRGTYANGGALPPSSPMTLPEILASREAASA